MNKHIPNVWTPLHKELPQENRLIVWISPDGGEVEGHRIGNLYFHNGMYGYYTPTFWKYA